MPQPQRHRRHAPWLLLAVLGIAALAAVRAPAVAPPDLDLALASQLALAAERPASPEVHNDLGNLLTLAGDLEAAEEAYRRALELAPEMTSARYNLGLLLLQTGYPKEALQAFRKVVEAEPDHAWAHYQIGAIHDLRGRDRSAIRHYGLAFRLDPQLGFPEINPHVIQNQHVTEAMLLAYRHLPVVSQVPKAYEEPSRIVNLMVSEPMVGEAAPATAGERAEAPGVRPTPTFAPDAAGQAEPGTGPAGNRVLREEDLRDGGRANQVVVPGAIYQPPRGGTRVPPVRTPTQPPPGTTRDGRQPGATPPPGRQRFIPGIPSTGRLEMELLPRPVDPVAPAG